MTNPAALTRGPGAKLLGGLGSLCPQGQSRRVRLVEFLKQDVLLLGRLLAPELGASETTRAGPRMDLGDSDPGWEVAGLPHPSGQAGREARPG